MFLCKIAGKMLRRKQIEMIFFHGLMCEVDSIVNKIKNCRFLLSYKGAGIFFSVFSIIVVCTLYRYSVTSSCPPPQKKMFFVDFLLLRNGS
jgi:hypothetical protein